MCWVVTIRLFNKTFCTSSEQAISDPCNHGATMPWDGEFLGSGEGFDLHYGEGDKGEEEGYLVGTLTF